MRHLGSSDWFVETHDALDSDAENDLNDGAENITEDACQKVEGDTAWRRKPNDDRLNVVEALRVDDGVLDHTVDRDEPRDVRDESNEGDKWPCNEANEQWMRLADRASVEDSCSRRRRGVM